MNKEEYEKIFWNYYLELERQYLKIDYLIPFDKINYNTFSYKYMELLSAICAEIDVLFKLFMNIENYYPEVDNNNKPQFNINQYEKFIENCFPNFKTQEIYCYNPKFYKKKIYPFKNWGSNSPKWWGIYNKIKHNPEQIFKNKKAYLWANQICTLNALGALFQLNLYVFRNLNDDHHDELKVPIYESLLFKLVGEIDYYKYIINGRQTSHYTDDFIDEVIKRLEEKIENLDD